MKVTMQLTIEQMENIINAAKAAKLKDSSLSDTVEIERTRECDTHTGGDMVGVTLKSNYAECVGESIYWHWGEESNK